MGQAKQLNPFYHLLWKPLVSKPREKARAGEREAAQAEIEARGKPTYRDPGPTLGRSPAPWEPKASDLNTILGVK